MFSIENHPKISLKLIDNITGWLTFVIASITYLLTIEPTASLWDCGEFIVTSAGLQVGHPPGAPLFMIISRLFAIFSPTPDKQAMMINAMSALCSAATILFLFWSITHLARKLIIRNGRTQCSVSEVFAIMGAGFVGALAYTFSDTFWFSAVEGEVYAMSSLFTAVVFWAILKWEDVADEPYSNRWIVLIAFLIGLSIGVHLLNLLAIPAIIYVYYFKKFKTTRKGFIYTGIISLIVLGFINFMLIPGVVKVAGWFELMFVNGMGLPFNTGVAIYVALIIAGLILGIKYTHKHGHTIVNMALNCFMVIMIGYSSYSMVVIRSLSDPPIDENSPDNVFDLLSYIQRDQYGQSPLLYGQYYCAPLIAIEDGEPIYYKNNKTGKYEKIGNKPIYKYDPRFCGAFPRMHSSNRSYFESQYEVWGGTPNGPIYDVDGKPVQKPSFGNNLRFFFRYQLNFMYWRYFMWNFSGRQNDEQGYGGILDGNWITGIGFLDEMRLGNQAKISDDAANSRARNTYYLLPLILGLFGLLYQFQKGKEGKQDFFTVLLLFVLTGIAIIIFLNQTPMEPRERDYAYAGSFYAFAIWIGLGVLYFWELLSKNKKYATIAAVGVSVICFVAVPLNMAAQNWDDHDRSGRYATVAHAKNYLSSCAPNAILFTYGDNDTFPLWYVQEVEGFRRDIRIVNLSLLSGDWYIDQMKRKTYETPGVPISMTKDQYHAGLRDQIAVQEQFSEGKIRDVVEFVASDLPQTKARYGNSDIDYIPTRHIVIPIDSAKMVNNGTIPVSDASRIVKNMEINITGNYLTKSQLMVLDIISTNNWERPIYFGIGMGKDSYLGFEKYFRLEGATLRVVPVVADGNNDEYTGFGDINSDILYDNLMNKFTWGNIKDPKVNIDHYHRNNVGVMKYRNTFLRLAEQLHSEGQDEKAIKALDRVMEELPTNQIPADQTLLFFPNLYYQMGEFEKGDAIIRDIFHDNYQNLEYVSSLSRSFQETQDVRRLFAMSRQIIQILMESLNNAQRVSLYSECRSKLNLIFGESATNSIVPKTKVDTTK